MSYFIKLLLSILICFSLFPTPANAIVDPLFPPNNKFGIHILSESDLEDAAKLVNSSGGDWGYVTIVIRSDERDTKRWQEVFNKMRRLHLIPIVRIATKTGVNGWEKPNEGEIDGWVSFLGDLNWVTQNRYVMPGNEPNHDSEWGGEANPEEYARYLKTISQKLKSKSQDFYVLNAGFDASAPNGNDTMSEEAFIRRMVSAEPNIFDHIDGWSSHSYPNPDFSGSQDDKGRGTVETFKWELALLKSLGVNREFPVFITETGWRHDKENEKIKAFNLTEVTDKLVASYDIAWKDARIVAITPFVLNYQTPPFDIFSWKKPEGTYYEIYEKVQKLPKVKGDPKQIESVDILNVVIPPIIPVQGQLMGLVTIKNNGQSIWEGEEVIYTNKGDVELMITPLVLLSDITPGQKTPAIVKLKR